MGFVTSKVIVYWVLRGQQGSIPFTRSTSPPLILNGLQPRYSSAASDSLDGFNEPHLRSDFPTLCFNLCASAPIDGSAVAVSV